MSLIILMFGSSLGLLSNIIASVYMDVSDYGDLMSDLNLCVVLSVVMNFGLPSFFIANKNYYKANISNVLKLILILNLGFATCSVFLVKDYLHFYLYSSFYVLNVVVAYRILANQINVRSVLISLNQILPSVVKFFGAIFLVFNAFFNKAYEDKLIILFGQTIACVIVFGFFLKLAPKFKKGSLVDGACFVWRYKRKLCYYYFSSILAIVYSLAMLPLANYYWPGHASSYLGLYMIYWSVVNIFITAFINNKLLPSYSNVVFKGDTLKQKEIMIKSISVGASLSVLTLVAVALSSVFADELWDQYPNVDSFILLASIPLATRPLSASIGMIANFHNLIKWKMLIQFLVFLMMLTIFYYYDPSDLLNALLKLLYTVEIFLFLCYLLLVSPRLYGVLGSSTNV